VQRAVESTFNQGKGEARSRVVVIPAKAGIQRFLDLRLDSRFRGNDEVTKQSSSFLSPDSCPASRIPHNEFGIQKDCFWPKWCFGIQQGQGQFGGPLTDRGAILIDG
jgi:hypothetical protein